MKPQRFKGGTQGKSLALLFLFHPSKLRSWQALHIEAQDLTGIQKKAKVPES